MTEARRYFITGGGGMLGTGLAGVLLDAEAEFELATSAELDVTDAEAVAAALARFAAEGSGVVINAAAYTDVEGAETERERAFAVNERGAANVARAAAESGLSFVHVSTDFVFDGEKDGPYLEHDEPNPLSVYGASKLAGERAVADAYPNALMVRTSWVYGPPNGGFPGKIIAAARTRPSLAVVDDEKGRPTLAADLAAGIVALIDSGAQGLFHLAGTGECTRFELALEALRLAGISIPVDAVAASEFPSKVRRPRNAVLDCTKAESLGVVLPHWDDALRRFIGELQ